MGTQRKKAECAKFENDLERRASNTKRLHNERAKTYAEDHATTFSGSVFVPSSYAARTDI